VNPTAETCTVALPWYDREDFQWLWELAHDRDEMPPSYEEWYASALRVMEGCLARGRGIQIVTVRSDELLAWLDKEGLPHTAASRLKYVEQRANRAGSVVGNAGIAADPRVFAEA